MFRTIVHIAVHLLLLVLWAGIGLATWLPFLSLAIGVYVAAMIGHLLRGRTGGHPAGALLDEAEKYYLHGFENLITSMLDFHGHRSEGPAQDWGEVFGGLIFHGALTLTFWSVVGVAVLRPTSIGEVDRALRSLVHGQLPAGLRDAPPCTLVHVETSAAQVRLEGGGTRLVAEPGSTVCLSPGDWHVALRYPDSLDDHRDNFFVPEGAGSLGMVCNRDAYGVTSCTLATNSLTWRFE